MSEALLEVRNLVKHFPVGRATVRAVDGVTLSIRRGETLGLVGESGCGKTTTGRCVLLLERPTQGEIVFEGIKLNELPDAALRKTRRRISLRRQRRCSHSLRSSPRKRGPRVKNRIPACAGMNGVWDRH